MANVSSSNTTTLYSTTQTTPIQQGAPVATGQVNDANFTTLYTAGQQVSPNANFVVPGTLTVNGCNILTNCSTFNILPTTATTVNLGGAATSVNIGANTGVTLINNQLATANYTFPLADGTANQVLTTDGAGNVYWALPGGGGSQFGNITIGITTDNTIDTTTGDLFITSDTGLVVVEGNLEIDNNLTINADQSGFATITAYGGATSNTITWNGSAWEINDFTRIINSTPLTSSVSPILTLRQDSTGTPAVGFGGNITYQLETPGSGIKDAAYLPVSLTDTTPGAEDARFRIALMEGGTLPNPKLTVDSSADMLVTGDQFSTTPVGIGGQVATNDYWHIGGYSVAGAGNDGALEIATANNSNVTGQSEPIYVRQYGGGSTSGNAWPWGNTITRTLTLLDNNGDTTYPGQLNGNSATIGGVSIGITETGSLQNGTISVPDTQDLMIQGGSTLRLVNDFIRMETDFPPNPGSTKAYFNLTAGPLSLGQFTFGGNDTDNPGYTLYSNYNFGVKTNAVVGGYLELTGSSSGYSRFSAPATGSNLTYVLPSAAGAANTVLTNDGSGNLTWALPGGGGSTFGNITVGVVTDNTISTTTGDLILDSATNNVNVTADLNLTGAFKINGATSGYSQFSVPATGNNISYVLPGTQGIANTTLVNDGAGNLVWNVYNPFDQSLNTTDSVQFLDLTVGGGPGNYFQTQLGVSVTLNIDAIQIGDGTSANQGFNINGGVGHSAAFYFDPATDSFVFSADVGGNRLLLNPADADFKTPIKISGSSSGSSTFAAPATGSTLSYVLPGTAGAANTVLTNDGSGNLSWALPGGGGSTFGNVSIGVVTDNTISTTSGDLDITSTTGVINLDNYTAFTDNRLTTTSTSTVTLDSLAIATYQSASYTITVKDNVSGATQFTKIDLLHDGSVAYINQYSNMASIADLSTFSATISGANAVLQITPASANSTQFTFNRIATKV